MTNFFSFIFDNPIINLNLLVAHYQELHKKLHHEKQKNELRARTQQSFIYYLNSSKKTPSPQTAKTKLKLFRKCWMAFWLLSSFASSRLNLQLYCIVLTLISKLWVYFTSCVFFSFCVSHFFSLRRITLLYYQRWKDNSLIDMFFLFFFAHTNALHHK